MGAFGGGSFWSVIYVSEEYPLFFFSAIRTKWETSPGSSFFFFVVSMLGRLAFRLSMFRFCCDIHFVLLSSSSLVHFLLFVCLLLIDY